MRQVLEYLFGRLKAERPVTHKVDGVTYAVTEDGTLGDPVLAIAPQWTAPTLEVSTLSAFASAVRARVDNFGERSAVQVVDTTTVELLALDADEYGRRHIWVGAKHRTETPFKFNVYYQSPEEFLIAFRASFYFEENAVKVQQLCSSVSSGDAVTVADDGISQEVSIKSGAVTKSSVSLPAEGVSLIAWRTFRDAAPVSSRYLLRMRQVKDSLPQIALFEIDQKWRLDTVQSVADWLRKALPEAIILA